MTSPVRTLAGLPLYKYNRESVERGLTAHFGQGGEQGWSRYEKGYVIPTGKGLVRLKSVREAALFCIAAKEGIRRKAVAENREAALQEMVRVTEEAGLYDDEPTLDEARAAVKQIRQGYNRRERHN